MNLLIGTLTVLSLMMMGLCYFIMPLESDHMYRTALFLVIGSVGCITVAGILYIVHGVTVS